MYFLSLHMYRFPSYQHPCQSGAFITVDGPALTHHHPKLIVYTRAPPLWETVCKFAQKCIGMDLPIYRITQRYFSPKGFSLFYWFTFLPPFSLVQKHICVYVYIHINMYAYMHAYNTYSHQSFAFFTMLYSWNHIVWALSLSWAISFNNMYLNLMHVLRVNFFLYLFILCL